MDCLCQPKPLARGGGLTVEKLHKTENRPETRSTLHPDVLSRVSGLFRWYPVQWLLGHRLFSGPFSQTASAGTLFGPGNQANDSF